MTPILSDRDYSLDARRLAAELSPLSKIMNQCEHKAFILGGCGIADLVSPLQVDAFAAVMIQAQPDPDICAWTAHLQAVPSLKAG